jgi:hypothetical protein
MDCLGSNVSSSEISKKNKTKKSFMQQLASSTADTPVSALLIGGIDHGQVVEKQVTPILGIRLSVKKRKLSINEFDPFQVLLMHFFLLYIGGTTVPRGRYSSWEYIL